MLYPCPLFHTVQLLSTRPSVLQFYNLLLNFNMTLLEHLTSTGLQLIKSAFMSVSLHIITQGPNSPVFLRHCPTFALNLFVKRGFGQQRIPVLSLGST